VVKFFSHWKFRPIESLRSNDFAVSNVDGVRRAELHSNSANRIRLLRTV
jgi:hypothetical protein